jgi:sigma-54 dependent transcriptional regulator, acetoin dehydrogenase operon transcriptional activator AcoR
MLRADPIAPESPALRPASAQIGANPMTRHGRSLDEIKREAITAVMHEFGGNVSAAARQLGINRNTLYRRMARMN